MLLVKRMADFTAGCSPYLGTGENGLPSCDMSKQDYLEGQWKRVNKQCRPHTLEELGTYAYPYRPDCNPAAHLCTPETDICRTKVLRISRFAWYPTKCSLQSWNAIKLSKQIGNRTVVFLGDSISVQQFFSLKQMLTPARPSAGPDLDWTQVSTVDGGLFQLVGTQFLVGEGIDKIENQSLEVLPDAEWVDPAIGV